MVKQARLGKKKQGHRTSRRCAGCNQWFRARGQRRYCGICAARLRHGLPLHGAQGGL